MANVKGLPVAYATMGGLLLWSGVKGSSLTDTVKSVLGGNAPSNGQTIGTPSLGVTNGTGSTPGTAGTSSTPASGSEADWITAVLSGVGAPSTGANIDSLTDWISHESVFPGGPGKGGQWNPLNTTQTEPGSTQYNSVGVQNYSDEQQGIQATIATLTNGNYSDILAMLRAGKGLKSGASAGLSKWSGGGYTSV